MHSFKELNHTKRAKIEKYMSILLFNLLSFSIHIISSIARHSRDVRAIFPSYLLARGPSLSNLLILYVPFQFGQKVPEFISRVDMNTFLRKRSPTLNSNFCTLLLQYFSLVTCCSNISFSYHFSSRSSHIRSTLLWASS